MHEFFQELHVEGSVDWNNINHNQVVLKNIKNNLQIWLIDNRKKNILLSGIFRILGRENNLTQSQHSSTKII